MCYTDTHTHTHARTHKQHRTNYKAHTTHLVGRITSLINYCLYDVRILHKKNR